MDLSVDTIRILLINTLRQFLKQRLREPYRSEPHLLIIF